ncbi:glycosyltransferase family 2 protein [uncultured Faecalibaculum sp.]|uniref:glycosyltransferase family 2 protein n=1 Tax=uncultured Faecalibaculum sp. TaxID=1729681 RepID=UPI00272E89B9|nr:glycosyltransferase family 2 protein [uncultured Faecalibaculum sp.]
MDDLISVIIPVYNVENYLEECLLSVKNQSYQNLEIILVNDGSTDASPEICKEFAKSDNRIRLINKVNGGLSDARNVGITTSTGEWITFVDSDDTVSIDYCSSMLDAARRNDSDLVIGGVKKFFDDSCEIEKDCARTTKCYSSHDALIDYYYRKLPGYACGSLVKREIIEDLRFPVGKCFEDAYFVPRMLQRTSKISYCEENIYFYRQRSGSIVNSKFSRKNLDQYYMVAELPESLINFDDSMRKAVNSKLFISGLDTLRKCPLGNRNYESELQQIRDSIHTIAKDTYTDRNNTFITRILAYLYYCNPDLAIVLSKMRKYIKIQRA